MYGEGNSRIELIEISTNECPVAIITPESKFQVENHNRAHYVNQGSGASLYGPNLSLWPAREVEVLSIIQQERNRIENAAVNRDQ